MKRLMELFQIFFSIGLFSIGGGYAIIPLIEEEVVKKNSWISQGVFLDIITISQMTPGPLAVNTSTFVGLQIAGVFGALMATLGCVIGGVALSIGFFHFFQKFQSSVVVDSILKGLRSVSLGLILSATVTILRLAFFKNTGELDWIAMILFVVTLLGLQKWKANPMLLLLFAGIAGGICYGN